MASNTFGNLFRITTWGESHGKGVGVVIDGCPAGLDLSNEEINHALSLRAGGKTPYTTARKEPDHAEIYSGVFEGKTTGTPISIIIHNVDVKSSHYDPIKQLLRPGHANFTYLGKYGIFDYRGGGRSSARETACRVAAGVVAKKLLANYDIYTCAALLSVHNIHAQIPTPETIFLLQKQIQESAIFCPDADSEEQMMAAIAQAKQSGDSLGGVVTFMTNDLPVGLGDPVYEKLEANLAKAMLSIPASKGFEIGEGFHATTLFGSHHNDSFIAKDQKIKTKTNHSGGTLGGISTGMPLYGRVAFKPTSSIKIPQTTTDLDGNATSFQLPEGSRHDPCVAVRAVSVVDAMCALVLADALLMNRCAKL